MASAKDTLFLSLRLSLPLSRSLSFSFYSLYCLFDRYDSGLALIISLGRLHEVVNARLKRAAVATVLRSVIVFHPADFFKFHRVSSRFSDNASRMRNKVHGDYAHILQIQSCYFS